VLLVCVSLYMLTACVCFFFFVYAAIGINFSMNKVDYNSLVPVVDNLVYIGALLYCDVTDSQCRPSKFSHGQRQTSAQSILAKAASNPSGNQDPCLIQCFLGHHEFFYSKQTSIHAAVFTECRRV